MSLHDIDSTTVSDVNNISYSAGFEPWNRMQQGFADPSEKTDVNAYIVNAPQWLGFYKTLPMVRAVIDKLAIWTIGKGFKAKNKTTKTILEKIKGNGKDTFNTILSNMQRGKKIYGDIYAEIILDRQNRLANLKPLDPGTLKLLSNNKGIIKGYMQVEGKTFDEKMAVPIDNKKTFKPEQIFHLSNDRIADEIHGIPMTESLQTIIKMWWIALQDQSVIFHRYASPMLLWMLETDDNTEIATFKAKDKQRIKNQEPNMYIPKDTASLERMSIPQYSTLDPMPWIKLLETQFLRSAGVPEIILGHSDEASEATSKIMYLAFQQTIEWEQLFLQEQLKSQLGIEVEFEFPASIDPELAGDARKNTGNDITQTDPTSEKKSDATKKPKA